MAAEALKPNVPEVKNKNTNYQAPGVEGFERHDNISLLNEGKFADYIKEVIALKQNPEKMAALYEKIKKIDTSIKLTAHEKKLQLRAIPQAEMLATVAEKIISDPDGKGITIQLNFRKLVFSRRWAIGAGDLLPVVVNQVTFLRKKPVVGTRHGRKFYDKDGESLATKGGPQGGLYLRIRPEDIISGEKATDEAEAEAAQIDAREEVTKHAGERARILMPEVVPTPTPAPAKKPEEEPDEDAIEDARNEKREVPPMRSSVESHEVHPEVTPKQVITFGDSQAQGLKLAGSQFESRHKAGASINYVRGLIEKNLLAYLISHPDTDEIYTQTGGNDVASGKNGRKIFDAMQKLVASIHKEVDKFNAIIDKKNIKFEKFNATVKDKNDIIPLLPHSNPRIIIGNLMPRNKGEEARLRENEKWGAAREEYNHLLAKYLKDQKAKNPNYKDEYEIFDVHSVVADEKGFQRKEFQRMAYKKDTQGNFVLDKNGNKIRTPSRDHHLSVTGYKAIYRAYCERFNIKTDKNAPIQVATLPESQKGAEPRQKN